MDIMNQWNSLDITAQMNMLTANIKKAAKNEIGYSAEDHYNGFNERVAWFMNYHQLDGLVNDAWIILTERLTPDYLDKLNQHRAESGKENITLISLVYRSAKDAIRTVYREDIKHGHSDLQDTDRGRKDNTEAAALTEIIMSDFIGSRDEIDRMIIEGKRDGYTGREIAVQASVTEAAISKRIKKMKPSLCAAIA